MAKMKTIYIILLLVAATGLCVFALRKKQTPLPPGKNSSNKGEPSTQEVFLNDNDEVSKPQILEEPSLSPMIKYFRLQCNAIRNVALDAKDFEFCKKVFDYADMVIENHGDDLIKEWWSTFNSGRNTWTAENYYDKGKILLAMIREAGVTPSAELVLRWNANAERHYISIDEVNDGDICDVINPCWIYKNEIFEKGIVVKQKSKES